MTSTKLQCHDNFEYYKLDWDTQYFGVNSARVNLHHAASNREQDDILAYCSGFDFITIANMGGLSANDEWLGRRTHAFLVDTNIQFLKKLSELPVGEVDGAKVSNQYPEDQDIMELSETAFRYSRFFNDPKLPVEKKREVYVKWAKDAFDKKDKYFVICKRENRTAGYILFSMNKETKLATIELIAVSERYRGQNTGKTLMCAMERYVQGVGIEAIKVGTQVVNHGAINFYHACGFMQSSTSSIYHLWTS